MYAQTFTMTTSVAIVCARVRACRPAAEHTNAHHAGNDTFLFFFPAHASFLIPSSSQLSAFVRR